MITKKQVRSTLSLLLVILMAVAMLLTSACGKDKPDTSTPVGSGDISNDIGSDVSSSTTGSDDTTTGTGDTTDVSDDTTSDVSDDTTSTSGGSATGNGKNTNTSGNNKTSGTIGNSKTSGTNKTTKPTSGGILVTSKTTNKTQATTSTTAKPIDKTVKEKVLSLFNDSMKGKTVSFLIHYTAESDTDKLKQMEAETGVKIKFQIAEYETFGTRLSALINASSSPDVAYFRSEQYAPMVNKDVILDLRETKFNLDLDIFDTELMDIFTWNGKRLAVTTKNSADGNFTVCYYNKTIFDRVGATDPGTLWQQGKWNWDTFLQCAQAVNDPASGRWGCELYDSSVFLCSGGVGIITMGDGFITNNLSDSRIVNAWTFINKLHHEYKVTTGLAGAEENFATGKSAMLIGESWMWGTSNPIATTKDEWGVIPAPCAPGVTPSAIINPRGACVPIGARNPEAGLAAYVYWSSNDTYESKATTEDDKDLYPHHDRVALDAFYSSLWDMPKIADLSSGVIEYGGEYDRWTFSFDVFQSGMSGINSTMDKWKSAIDVCIKRIMTEFS